MKTNIAAAVVLVFLFGGLAGCASAPHLKPGYEPPGEVADRYQDALRWQDYELARGFIIPEAYPEFDAFITAKSGKLNIIEYSVWDVGLSEDGYLARVTVKRSYYLSPSVNPGQEELLQTWKLVNGKWYLTGPPF